MPGRIGTSSPTIGEMLRSGAGFIVPRYQRDYSWTEDKLAQFWDDLNGASTRDGRYFFGSMVVKPSTGGRTEIIDGQQRIATVSLLFCALRDQLRRHGDTENSTRLSNFFLSEYNPRTRLETPKITLNKLNARFYEDHIIEGPDEAFLRTYSRTKSNPKSNVLLSEAYLFFYDMIEKTKQNGELQEFLSRIWDVVSDKLVVIKIDVESDLDAYLLFETLNDRGLDLSVSDLLKNWLFSQATDEREIDRFEANWTEMVSTLGSLEINKFLRHLWMSQEGPIRDKDMFSAITEKYNSPLSVRSYSKTLLDNSSYYSAFRDPENDLWGMFDPQDRRTIAKHIGELRLYRVTQCLPLLLSVMEVNPELVPAVLRMVTVISFRYSVISNKSANYLERGFSDAAVDLRANPASSPSEIFLGLVDYYPSDEEFRQNFISKEDRMTGPMARYILSSINDFLWRGTGRQALQDPTGLNLEHILPKSPTQEWINAFGGEEISAKSFVHRIGNMTLLVSRVNRSISNAAFEIKKRDAYGREPLPITEPLLSADAWGPSQIEDRQAWFADSAIQVWRLDY